MQRILFWAIWLVCVLFLFNKVYKKRRRQGSR